MTVGVLETCLVVASAGKHEGGVHVHVAEDHLRLTVECPAESVAHRWLRQLVQPAAHAAAAGCACGVGCIVRVDRPESVASVVVAAVELPGTRRATASGANNELVCGDVVPAARGAQLGREEVVAAAAAADTAAAADARKLRVWLLVECVRRGEEVMGYVTRRVHTHERRRRQRADAARRRCHVHLICTSEEPRID